MNDDIDMATGYTGSNATAAAGLVVNEHPTGPREITKVLRAWRRGEQEAFKQLMSLAYGELHQAALKRAPLSQILIETDSPVEFQGKPSEPATLIETVHELARVKKIPAEEIARETTKNAERFYDMKGEGR